MAGVTRPSSSEISIGKDNSIRAHIHKQNKDSFVRIKASSALGPSVYGPFCEVHRFPFTRKDEKDRLIT